MEITSHTLDFALHRAELVLALDVTERLRDRRRLEESEQRFREIFNSMNDAVFIHDAESGRILQVNQRTLDLYGIREEEALAADFDHFSRGEEGFSVREAGEWLRKAREEGPQLFEWRSRAATGHVIWAEVNLRYVQLGDKSRILAVVRDISRPHGAEFSAREREIGLELACLLAVALHQHHLQDEVVQHSSELERRVVERTTQLQAANEELEAFTYSVGHDLRSPLRAVDGFSRMLEEDHADSLDAEARRLLGVIRDSTRQMDRLINDLLTLSRVSRIELRREWVDMGALVREVYPEVCAHETEDACALELAELPSVWGDRGLLRQVWLNLLGNAVKFSRHSAVKRVEVTGEVLDGVCRYSVRDQGAGFDPACGHKLFGVFQRLHAAHENEGSGVGLALVQRIVRRHGGQVLAEGAPERGACFHFQLSEQEEKS